MYYFKDLIRLIRRSQRLTSVHLMNLNCLLQFSQNLVIL